MIQIKTLHPGDNPIEYIARQTHGDPASQLIVFPTARNIRHFHTRLSRVNNDRAVISPYCLEMDRFITKCLDSGGRALVASSLRPFYLQRALKKIDRDRLDELFKGSSALLQEDFIEFAATGSRILRFYDEVYSEKIMADMLIKASLYTDYEKHIGVLEEIAKAYKSVLSEDEFTDPMFLKMKGDIQTDWLRHFQKIHFLVGGYLTCFEIDLLKATGAEKDITIILQYEGEPDAKTKKVFEAFEVEAPQMSRKGLQSSIEIRAYEEATTQFGFIIHSIERALQSGIPPEEIVIVLPNDSTKALLFTLDRKRIFSYAMGLDFRDTVWYGFLKSVQTLFRERLDHNKYRTDQIINFLKHPFIGNLLSERSWIDNLISKYKEQNRLIIGEEDFCRTEILKDVFGKLKKLIVKEHAYREFLLAIAEFMDYLFSKLDTVFVESLSQSPDFTEAGKVFLNYLYQSASLPYDLVYQGRNSLRHLHFLTEQLEKLTYSDVMGGFITVMGMLETRNLCFRAVIIPDMNEEMIPGRSEKEMFLNTSIREQLGMPTYHDRENLARHYFKALLKNADMVFLSYVERDDRPIRSRFIEEILIETGNKGDDPPWLKQRHEYADLVFDYRSVRTGTELPDRIRKDKTIFKSIDEMRLTPYKLNTYRLCSYKFYLACIKDLNDPVEFADELASMDIGNILHRALRNVYEAEKRFDDAGRLSEQIGKEVRKEANQYDIFQISSHAVFELDVLMDKLFRFAESEVKRFEEGWRPELIEYPLEMTFEGLDFSGRVDRIDVREDDRGSRAFIIDYKYAKVNRISNLRYSEDFSEFQLPLYRMMLGEKLREIEVEGFGYYDLKDTFALVQVKEHGTREDFTSLLEEVVGEIRSPKHEFVKTEDLRLCMHCGFARLCGRK